MASEVIKGTLKFLRKLNMIHSLQRPVWRASLQLLEGTTFLDEVFGFCRFSQMSDKSQVLYTTVMRAQGGSIVTWNSTSWKRMGSKQKVRDAISAFNVSADGKLLAIGTVQGDILIVNSTSMRTQMMVKKAHLGLVTALMFSQDSRALVSASLDSSARVTLIKEKTANGFSLWVIVFIIVLAIAAYALKTKGILP